MGIGHFCYLHRFTGFFIFSVYRRSSILVNPVPGTEVLNFKILKVPMHAFVAFQLSILAYYDAHITSINKHLNRIYKKNYLKQRKYRFKKKVGKTLISLIFRIYWFSSLNHTFNWIVILIQKSNRNVVININIKYCYLNSKAIQRNIIYFEKYFINK